MSQSKNVKAIRVAIKNGDDTKVKVSFYGEMFSVEEFTAVFMGVLEEYTKGMLNVNDRGQVFDHWNRVFGIFLNKIVPEGEHYERDPAHKALKEVVDETLGKGEGDPMDKMAAMMLCRDILINDVGLTEESADVILNRRVGLLPPVRKNAA